VFSHVLLYHPPSLDPAPWREALLELQLDIRCLTPPELVDVKLPRIYLLDGQALADARLMRAVADLTGDLSAVVVLAPPGTQPVDDIRVFGWLDSPPSLAALKTALRSALGQIELHERARRAQLDLDRRAAQLADLHHVGVALSAEHDADALQSLILTKARDITCADAGSLYLVVEDDVPALDDQGQPLRDADGQPITTRGKLLAFNKSQNFSNPADFEAFRMPLEAGIAGYVATTAAVVQHLDIYDLPEGAPYRFNRDFDQQTGYRSKSMLAVPMINSDNEVIGVIQLINRKYRADVKLTAENIDAEVLPFSLEDRDLTLSFATQAAIALDNRRLIDSIQKLFEGFVTASVQAIESRDPTTSGHSERVATLTVGLAEAVNGVGAGPLAGVRFGPESLRELRYAALLHDFGKVGVRENVLVKAKKLYDWQLEQIRYRFEAARATLEANYLRLKARGANEPGREQLFAKLDAEFERELAQLQASFELVRRVNEPAIMAEDQAESLAALAALSYPRTDGQQEPLLEPWELGKLSIGKGSLDENERLEIESHVTHTYKFLTKIPWTRELRRVPEIAWAHHERLDGSGYPNRLVADQIPLESRMMAIADVYDALTAWDRPYKRAVPTDTALDILALEAKDGHLDVQLLAVFIEQRVYRLTHKAV
jgi:HD-GYP domain-containing protein (c-di-GMP phosphodiesterase class II)